MIPVYQDYKKIIKNIENNEQFLAGSDLELSQLATIELEELRPAAQKLEAKLRLLSRIEDPLNAKNAIVEIQAGVGGDESSLFVEMLFGMYAKYAKKMGWEVEITDVSHGNQGGFKYISLLIEGHGAYGAFRLESGSHKIQRVSPTDSAKRMHTSAATVVVLPEEQEVKIEIKKADVKVEKTHSSGPGGQAVNKVETAIRVTHLPTKISVRCESRSQHANLERAWKILTSRVIDYYTQIENEKNAKERNKLRGDGSRGGCIRTYNFPQDRVTDHRNKHTVHNIEKIFAGDLDALLEGIQNA